MPIQDGGYTPQNKLGTRLELWSKSWGPGKWLVEYNAAFHERMPIVGNWLAVRGIALMHGGHPHWLSETAAASIYLYTGLDLVDVAHPKAPPTSMWEDPSEGVASVINQMLNNATARETAEVLGAAITTPFLSIMEGFAEAPDPDPHEVARAFHGASASLSIMGGMADTLAQGASAGIVRSIGPMFQSLYWNLGLGFLGWQTLAPLLTAGLQPKLERYYARRFRPARFSAAQSGDLFALGEMSGDELQETLRDLGWQDTDIERYRTLSYKRLGEGDVWKLFNSGQMSKSEVESRLRGMGYQPEDIPLAFKANDLDQQKGAKDVLLSTAKAAFKDGLISEADFRRIMLEQKYPAQEVELQLQLLRLAMAEEKGGLARSDIRQLYKARVIARPEAIAYLVKTKLTAAQADLLLKAWEEADAPTALRINQSTVRQAYFAGVLTKSAAGNWLSQVGYDDEAVDLLIKTWTIEIGQRPPDKGPLGAGKLTLAQLGDLFAGGFLTIEQLHTRPELNRYADADKELVITLLTAQPVSTTGGLSMSTLTDAYEFEFITRVQFVDFLQQRGLDPDEAELTVKTIDQRLDNMAADESAVTVKTPSVGALQLALQRGLIDEEQFAAKLTAIGFDAEAVKVYAFNAQYQAPATPELLSKTDVLGLYKKQKLTRPEAQYRLIQLGYTVEDAQLLIEGQLLAPADTEIGQAWIQGLIDTESAGVYLTSFGFPVEDVTAFFETYQS